MYNKSEILNYLEKYYPDTDTKKLCQNLGLSLSTVYTLANRNGIHKSNEYLKKQHVELMKTKEEKYLASIPDIKLTQLEQNIMWGAFLETEASHSLLEAEMHIIENIFLSSKRNAGNGK